MTLSKDGRYFYWGNGETAVIKLLTAGRRRKYGGRMLGGIAYKHVSREPVFDGKKAVDCPEEGCRFCSDGHKRIIEYRDVPIAVEGKPYLCNIQWSLHRILAGKVEDIIEDCSNPRHWFFKVTKTGRDYPDNWEVIAFRKIRVQEDRPLPLRLLERAEKYSEGHMPHIEVVDRNGCVVDTAYREEGIDEEWQKRWM